jgi:hypothetical protein
MLGAIAIETQKVGVFLLYNRVWYFKNLSYIQPIIFVFKIMSIQPNRRQVSIVATLVFEIGAKMWMVITETEK